MTDKLIIGSGGGGKGGGGGRVAKEAPNTLRSRQDAEVIDLISEGEIEGLVNGLRSVYFDQVPVQNPNGSLNFSGFSVETRNGTQSQPELQAALKGIVVTKGNPNSSIELKQVNPPQSVQIEDNRVSRVDVTIGIPQLSYQDPSTGDLKGSSVTFNITIRKNGGGVLYNNDLTIKGKCTSTYQESYEYTIPNDTLLESDYPLLLSVSRVSQDPVNVNTQNRVFFYSYTEHIPVRLSYPNSAVVGVSVDADQFSQIPTRGYLIKGIKVKIPTNYNPLTRTYNGVWDGTFTTAWTNNPAWIYYDLLTERRYGLGDFLDEESIDKWSLYEVARYCDEFIPDGFGGVEPRFTCNLYLQNQEDAYSAMASIASIFRAMQYWAAGQITVAADMPKDPVAQFTPSNIIDGVFNYSGSSTRTRHTVALVTWNDPDDFYKQKIEYVEDPEGVRTRGVISTSLVAVGCTSRGQAHRIGKWLLFSERMETETISFTCGIDHALVAPGDVIQTVDPFRAGERLGGRVKQVISNAYYFDQAPDDGQYTLSILAPEMSSEGRNRAKIEQRVGQVIGGVFYRTSSEFTREPQPNDIWVASRIDNLEPELWRVISITEEDNLTATITALEYRPDKFAAVENNLKLEPRPVSTIDYSAPEAPYIPADNQTTWFMEYLYVTGPGVLNNGATFSWTSSAPRFIFKIAGEDGVFEQYNTTSPTIDIKPLEVGFYTVEIYAENTLGIRSQPLVMEVEVLGKMKPPRDVTGFLATKTQSGIRLTWDQNTFDLDLLGYEIREIYELPEGAIINSSGQVCWCPSTITDVRKNQIWDSLENQKLDSGVISNNSFLDTQAETGVAAYLIKAIDTSGNYSELPVVAGLEIGLPQTPTNVRWFIDGEALVVAWDPPQSDLGVASYTLQYDGVVELLDRSEFRRTGWFNGTEGFFIRATDNVGNSGSAAFIEVTIDRLNPVLSLSSELVGDSYKLSWGEPNQLNSMLPVYEYEIRTDLNWGESAGLVSRTFSTTYQEKVTWETSRTFYVAAYDTSGNIGEVSSITLSIVRPSEPLNYRATVVDNNVLLFWDTPLLGSLPIDSYEVRRGPTWETAESIGTKAGKFTSVFETIAGDYVYWLAAINTAGFYGVPTSLAAKVNQPPDYVLQNNYYSNFPGYKENAFINSSGSLAMPVNLTETWEEHFTLNGWDSPQDQIAAGYPVYIQPTLTSGVYEEVIDYTPTFEDRISSSTLTITPNIEIVIPVDSITYIVSYSEDGVVWSLPTEGTTHFLTNFKYVKVRIEVEGGLVEFKQLNIKLDSKLKTASGSAVCSADDVDGTIIYLTDTKLSDGEKVFLEVDSITVTPSVSAGVVPVAVYDFVDIPNPLFFKVLLYNSLTGERVTGSCSYSVRGY